MFFGGVDVVFSAESDCEGHKVVIGVEGGMNVAAYVLNGCSVTLSAK